MRMLVGHLANHSQLSDMDLRGNTQCMLDCCVVISIVFETGFRTSYLRSAFALSRSAQVF